ncbi:MAG TPA: hypothetical protein VLM85_14425 [Polyangiaceae bacterium]|nr:hypothetical protein [Polyangiaceae bacterium]
MPLGSTEAVRAVAIYSLLGDLWLSQDASLQTSPAFDRALVLPGVCVHLGGNREARAGRKVGHLSAAAKTPKEAVALVKTARSFL